MSAGRAAMPGQTMRLLITAAAALLLCACGSEQASAPAREEAMVHTVVTEPSAPGPELMARWSRNCALCHVRGEGGAPVLGDRAAWTVRLDKGEDVLLANTLEGLNNMPPLGYCMDCEEADFRALIRFMAGTP